MKVAFLTNYINHHQAPVADEMYKLTNGNYTFIATEQIYAWRKALGYPDFSDRPYLLNAYESDDMYQEAIRVINDADVVIQGASPESMIADRLKANKLTFRYAERYFKRRPWYFPDPRVWWNFYTQHTRYRNKNVYMLAASAYTANDVYHFFAYPDKCYKWGYFTAVPEISREHETDEVVRLMWCARYIVSKHPELPVKLAKRLKEDGYKFHLDMYGAGELMDETRQMVKNLDVEDVITIQGSKPNAEVVEAMRNHDIFLFTSDKNEGWGAVLNESMSQGCAAVASNMIGAAPFLIEDGKNGLIFKSENLDSLYHQTKRLMDDKHLRHTLSQNAIKTMQEMWSPKIAAQRFITLATNLLYGKDTPYTNGPCSKAYPFKHKD